MRLINLGRTAVKVSQMCLGAMNFGAKTDANEAERVVKTALDSGVNFLDTAITYNEGRSEEYLGRALKGARDQVFLATKVGAPKDPASLLPDPDYLLSITGSRYHIMRAIETSLKRLGTDHIDLYQMHMPHPGINIEEMLRAFDDLVRQGKVLYVGCSNFPAWLLCKSLWLSDLRNLVSLVSLQSVYNLIERGVEIEVLPLCRSERIAFLAYRPVCAGVLAKEELLDSPSTGDTARDQWRELFHDGLLRVRDFARARGRPMLHAAIAWLTSHPAVTIFPLVGASRAEQVPDIVSAFDWTLSPEERDELTSYLDTEPRFYHSGVHGQWRTNLAL